MDEFMIKYETTIDKAMKVLSFANEANYMFIKALVAIFRNLIGFIMEIYETIAIMIYTPFRWTTIPLNYIIIRTWLWYVFRDGERELLDATGVHYVQAKPGGGKSMLAFQKANEIADDTGYSSYMTDRIEKPRLSKNGRFYVVTHKVFDIKKIYKNGKKVKEFDTTKYKSLFIDEFHRINNNRLFNQKDYKDFFIPFINDLIVLRHKGFDNNIYLFSQMPSNDIQIMSLLVYYHEVELKKGISYLNWLFTGKFKIQPLKFKLLTYKIDLSNNNKKKLYRKWTKKVDIERLEYFDTHALRSEFKDLDFI